MDYNSRHNNNFWTGCRNDIQFTSICIIFVPGSHTLFRSASKGQVGLFTGGQLFLLYELGSEVCTAAIVFDRYYIFFRIAAAQGSKA
jgi:hypothetical protein